jgi:O-antigen/teichoic acid export membrane protein
MSIKDRQKDSLVGVIAKYSSSNIYYQILGLLNAFIRPKLLTPELYGLWHILIVIPKYSAYSTLGTHTIMRYLIPYHDSRSEQQQISDIKGTIFYSALITKILIAAVLVIILLTGHMSLKVRLGLLTMAYLVIMEWYSDYYITTLKAYQRFNLVTSSNYIQATVAFMASAVLIYFLNIYGVYLSAIITFMVIISYLRTKYPLGSFGVFRFSLFIDLVKKGFPLMIYDLSSVLISSTDKIIIAYFLGTAQLGYYGISVMVFGFLMQLPGASREVIEPRLMQKLDKDSNEETLKEYFLKPLINAAYFMPFLIGPIFFILPVIISLILPRYISGILPSQIIALGGYFFSLICLFRGIIVANNWQVKASLVPIVLLFVHVTLSILFIKLGYGINGVAASCSISFFLLFVSLFFFVRKRCYYAEEDWRQITTGICWPFPVMCATIFLLNIIAKILHTNIYLSAVCNLFLFSFTMLILINFARRKYVLLKGIELREIWKSF